MTWAGGALRPAVFLDRDGTIIEERSYLADPGGVKLLPGTLKALQALGAVGIPYVIVTNQSGVGRGLYTEEEYHAVAARLQRILEDAGVPPEGTWYCPHHPDSTGPCECRKPGTGMYRAASQALGLDLERSWYVGDKLSDVLPALELGGAGILVRTGYGEASQADVPAGTTVVDDLGSAVRWILAHRRENARDDVDPPGGLG